MLEEEEEEEEEEDSEDRFFFFFFSDAGVFGFNPSARAFVNASTNSVFSRKLFVDIP